MVDVGGSRSQRNVWAQFFHDATAIIFLAPISAFDEVCRLPYICFSVYWQALPSQYLEEAPDVNRVLDSLQIWHEVIINPLLYNVSLILFLNSESTIFMLRYTTELGRAEMDLFRHKLSSGVKIKDYFLEYQGTNDYESEWSNSWCSINANCPLLPAGGRFFKGCFHKIVSDHRHTAPTRSLYVHKTTATSTKEIQVILLSTKDAILRHHLKESGFAWTSYRWRYRNDWSIIYKSIFSQSRPLI